MEKTDVMDLTLEEMWELTRVIDSAMGCANLILPDIDIELDFTAGDIHGIAQQIIAEGCGYCE